MSKPINLERSFAMDDSCQMMFWAKGHHSWGDFIAAVEAELHAEERTDIPEWVIYQAPVKQTYQRSVPCSGNIVADRQFIYQDEPGRGATAVTVMNFWYPIHAAWNRRAQAAEEVQPVAVVQVGGWEMTNSLEWFKDYGLDRLEPGTALYTRPPAADADRMDAERYRWLLSSTADGRSVKDSEHREKIYAAWRLLESETIDKAELDAAIDAALAASKENSARNNTKPKGEA